MILPTVCIWTQIISVDITLFSCFLLNFYQFIPFISIMLYFINKMFIIFIFVYHMDFQSAISVSLWSIFTVLKALFSGVGLIIDIFIFTKNKSSWLLAIIPETVWRTLYLWNYPTLKLIPLAVKLQIDLFIILRVETSSIRL